MSSAGGFHTCNPFPCLETFRYLPEFGLGYSQGLDVCFKSQTSSLPCFKSWSWAEVMPAWVLSVIGGENVTKNIINLSEHKKKIKGGHFSHGHFNKASCPGIESVPTTRPRTCLWLIHLLALFPPKLPSAPSLSKSAGKSCWESVRGRLCVRGRCRLCRGRCRPCGEMLNGLIFGESYGIRTTAG